jgi:hypothetical protein
LVSRLQQHDERATLEAISDKLPPHSHNASAVAGVTPTPSAETGVRPGIPSGKQPNEPPQIEFLNVKIPDIQRPDPQPAVETPFVPDFWESSKKKVKKSSDGPVLPKLLVVAGDTQPGGPTHNLLDTEATVAELSVEESSKGATTSQKPAGFWQDVADDMGIPTSFSTGSVEGATKKKTVDSSKENGKGWLVLGLLAGSWIVGGIVNN